MKLQQRARTRTRQTTRRILLAASCVSLTVILVMISSINLTNTQEGYGATLGDYRSKASGNWNSTSTWEKYNGSIWINATSAPTSADGVIEILSGHIVAVSAAVTADQILVNAGGQLDINSTITLTVANGTGNDLDCSGIVKSTGTITLSSGAAAVFNNGSTYKMDKNGGAILAATWNTGSTCEITGVTTTVPTNLSQSFCNFTWNSTGQTGIINLNAAMSTVTGNYTVSSTGTGSLYMDQQGNNGTLTVSGNMNITGGTVYGCINGSTTINVTGNFDISGGSFNFNKAGGNAYGNTSCILTVTGNVSITGGTMDLSQYDGLNSAKGIGNLYIAGNLSLSGTGLLTEISLFSRGKVYFNGTSTQYFSNAGGNRITQKVDFTVNSGAVLRMDDQVMSGAGNFTLSAGGGLMIGSTGGIASILSTGNIQVTGTRSYNTGADYTYNGTAAQITGAGLPSTVRNLTFNNTSSGVTLSGGVSATGILTLTRGIVTTGIFELGTTNTATTAVAGYSSSAYVNGNLRRSVSASGSYDYPVGNSSNYELANVNLSSATGFTSIVGSFNRAAVLEALYPLVAVVVNGTPIEDMLNYGYWTLTPNSAMTGGTYSVTLNESGHSNSASTPQSYTVLKRSSVLASWQSLGIHNNNTQAEISGIATAVRSGLTSFSDYAIGKGNGSLPITLVSFDAKPSGDKIKLTWVTGNEINNDFFTIERSKDGRDFEPIIRKDGAGNSTSTLHYMANDESPLPGMNYYRLKQTDYDGKFTYSEIEKVKFEKGVSEEALKIESIGPNPFHESFNVNYSSEEEGTANVMLLSATGGMMKKEIVQVEKGLNGYEFIDNMNLQTGIYYITITMNDKAVTKKIIKN